MMGLTDLQLSLAGLGIAAVAGVWVYNKWQERSQRRRVERILSDEAAETANTAAEGTSRADARNANRGGMTQESPEGMPPDWRVEPVFDAPGFGASVESEPPAELADAMIDCVVYLNPEQPIAATAFWPVQRVHLGTLDGRLRWLVQDKQGGLWREISSADDGSCTRLCAALQLADRSGPISEVQLSKFFIGLRQLAEDFHASVDLPTVTDILARAHALDEFCASVDWRIAINVMPAGKTTVDTAALIRLLRSAGLRPADNGIHCANDDSGQTLFSVTRIGGQPLAEGDEVAAHGLTLTLDVPRVTDGASAFDGLLTLARQIAAALPGDLEDDQRVVLKDELLGAIRDKIYEFQQKMAERQIPAGGRRAIRLYS